MEDILRELIKATTENGPQKHFYSNLAITEPFQKHVEISTRITKGIDFLEKAMDSKNRFQSRPYTSKKCQELIPTNFKTPPEIYTSLLALELFGDGELEFSDASLKSLKDFILPESALTTLNIFKSSSVESEGACKEVHEDEDFQNMISDDCNTTSLVVSLLLREGILDYKPAASITELLLSNVPNIKGNSDVFETKFKGVVRTFFEGNESDGLEYSELDPITCANVLYLYYQTDMNLNYEENVDFTEIFLVETLKSLLATCKDQDQEFSAGILTKSAIHHSPDALVYFLSRVTSISQHAHDRFNSLLINLLDKRISKTSHVLDLSMRILSADALGILEKDNSTSRRKLTKDYERLAHLQNNDDGSWPADSLFKIRINGTDAFYGGREVSTIFACKALDVYYKSMKAVKIKTRLYKDFMY